MSRRDISGTRKAALLLVQLGPDRAGKILQALDDSEIEAVISEVTMVCDVDPEQGAAVLTELVEHLDRRAGPRGAGPAFARKVLNTGLGPERANHLLQRIGSAPFQELASLPVEQAVAVLALEHPQAVAVVLSSLPSDRGLALLQQMPEERRGDIAFRMAVMEPPTPAAVAAVEAGLAKRIAGTSRGDGGGGRPGSRWSRERSAALVELLQRADAELEASIMAEIERLDAPLAAELRLKLFNFDDLVKLDDKALQLVVREVDAKVLALALKGAAEGVRRKLLSNMSERAAQAVNEEAELLGAQRKTDIEAARMEVLSAMRALEAEGRITVARGDDSLVA